MSETYRIKPLVWRMVGGKFAHADSMFGQYTAHKFGPGHSWVVNTDSKRYSSIEAAKRAVEEYYRNKLLEALEEVK